MFRCYVSPRWHQRLSTNYLICRYAIVLGSTCSYLMHPSCDGQSSDVTASLAIYVAMLGHLTRILCDISLPHLKLDFII